MGLECWTFAKTNYGKNTTGIVQLKKIEYGCGYIIIRSPYTLYSIYLRGAIHVMMHAEVEVGVIG